eukprot:COSAG05_NODE_160_length_15590_cov_14.460848_6_plen_84_part_00
MTQLEHGISAQSSTDDIWDTGMNSPYVLVWRPDHCASKRVMHTDGWQTTIDLCIYTYRYIQTYYPALHTTHTMTCPPNLAFNF